MARREKARGAVEHGLGAWTPGGVHLGAGRRSGRASMGLAWIVSSAGLALAQPATPPGQGDLTAGGQPAASPTEAMPPSGDLTPQDYLLLAQQPMESDGTAFEVGVIHLAYSTESADNPSLDELMNVEFELVSLPEGYVTPVGRDGVPTVRTTLAQLNAQPTRTMYSSAIIAISAALVNTINTRYGVVGAYIVPDEIALQGGQDTREGGTDVTLKILLARVSQVRTIGTGRVPQDARRIDNPLHARIRGRSPVRAVGADGTGGLIRRDLLDDYVLRLNRHPGRRVDVAVAPGETEGEPVLDFLVSESRPWSVYFQVSNTGTEQTNEWRERFGFVHNQLTNHDDILSIDFITAAFDESNALTASYDARVFDTDRLRWNVYAGWDEYTASDVALSGDEFTGESWHVGGGLTWNIYQHREVFVDLLGGVRFEHLEVEAPGQVGGNDNLWFPYIGARADRTTDTDSWAALVRLEFQPGADENSLERLGRTSPDDSWVLLQAEGDLSFFLDPLFYGAGWADVRTDGPDYDSTLAHELAFSLKFQSSFGARVIPQVQQVAGGLYSVRGYDESIATGDDTLIFTAEYRFHLPRTFAAREPTQVLFGRPFKVAPQQPFGRPDWDLIFRGFLDVGQTWVSDATSFEDDQTLVGAGLGAELQVLRNFGARIDVGWVLQDVRDENDEFLAETGDVRVHLLFTLLF